MNRRIRTTHLLAALLLATIVLGVPITLAKTPAQDEVPSSFDQPSVKIPGTVAVDAPSSPYIIQDALAESQGLTAEVAPSNVAPLDLTIVHDDLDEGGPGINATRRISIPYGFKTPLPIESGGLEVLAIGHGGCTAGEEATIAVTITQVISPAMGTGETTQTCTGELQNWSLTVQATTLTSFVPGPAQACGRAVTRAGGYVTDTFDWCKDVDLAVFGHRVYVPLIGRP